MQITHEGCILTVVPQKPQNPKKKWEIPLSSKDMSEIIQQELTVTPFSSFCAKKGYSNAQNSFPIYRALSATRFVIPRQFVINTFPLETCSEFNLFSEKARWASEKHQILPLSVPLRPLQHEIVYERLFPHLADSFYRANDAPEQTFFFGGGIYILPCGYGKTKTVEEFFYALGQHVPNGYRMLVICPTKAICKQTAISFRKDLKGCKVAILRASDSTASAATSKKNTSEKRVLVCAAASNDKNPAFMDVHDTEVPTKVLNLIRSADVVVTLMSTLKSRRYGSSFYEHFGIVVIDEVHHMTAKGNSQLFLQMNPPILLGITAEFDNSSKTFGMLEKCIGPRLFEKRDRDGQDDIVVRKCRFPQDVLDYLFRKSRADDSEKRKRFTEIVNHPDGSVNYTITMGNLFSCHEIVEYWADHVEYMLDFIPEDHFFMKSMKKLLPFFAPIETPDLCSLCFQECVFSFRLQSSNNKQLCSGCITKIYFQDNNSFEDQSNFLPEQLVQKTQEDQQTERETATRKKTTKTKSVSKKRKAQDVLPVKNKRTRASSDSNQANGDEAMDCMDDEEEIDESDFCSENGLLDDSKLEELLRESLELSKDIYRSTYFGRNQILILCERVEPLLALSHQLQTRRPETVDVGILAGKKVSEEDLLCARGKQIILATLQRAKEGMDIPTINTVVFLSPMKSIRQSMGRSLRTAGRKYVYDFIYPATMFWIQFQNSRKPEYDAHRCKYENFFLPCFKEWKRNQMMTQEDVEEEEENSDETMPNLGLDL